MLQIATIVLLLVSICSADYSRYRPKTQPDNQSYESYEFGYETKDSYGTIQTRQESGDKTGTVKGSYSLTLNDGISRTVQYIADNSGFRANIKTNEPGVEKSNPADVIIDGPEKAWAEEGRRSNPVPAYTPLSTSRPSYSPPPPPAAYQPPPRLIYRPQPLPVYQPPPPPPKYRPQPPPVYQPPPPPPSYRQQPPLIYVLQTPNIYRPQLRLQ